MSFRAKITTKGHDTYESWRDGDHDDLVLALALGSWYFERTRLNRHSSVNLNVSGMSAVQDC
jgi:hypothetical protein